MSEISFAAGTVRPQLPSGGSVYDRTLLGRFDRRVLQNTWVRWGLVVLAAVVLIVPTIQFIDKIHEGEYSLVRERYDQDSALGRWLPDAVALREGGNPYGERHWFPSPPLVLMALVPLAPPMPLTATAIIWAVLKLAAIVGGCWLVVKTWSDPARGRAIPLGVLLMAAVFAGRPVIGDITHANINAFVFFEIALACFLFARGRDGWCGLVLGLAVVTKVTPALLVVYFLYKRAWRVVLGAALGVILFAGVLPSLVLGPQRNLELLRGWAGVMIEPFVEHGFVTVELKNQSLPGTLLRLGSYTGLVDLEHVSEAQARQYGVYVEQMARPQSPLVRAALRGVNLAVLLVLAWLCRTPLTDRRDPRLLLEISLVLLAMFLLSERTWKHHLTTLPIVYLGTWLVISGYPWSRVFTAAFVAGLVAQLLMLVVLKGDVLMYVGIITWGLLLCMAQNALLLRRLQRAGP